MVKAMGMGAGRSRAQGRKTGASVIVSLKKEVCWAHVNQSVDSSERTGTVKSYHQIVGNATRKNI